MRHGETESVRLRLQDHSYETPLNGTGIKQAEAAAKELRAEPIDIILASPMRRAEETARIIAQHHPDARFITDDLLRERGQGIYHGRPYTDFDSAWHASGQPFQAFRPEEGESLFDVYERIAPFCAELHHWTGKTVLIVAHMRSLGMLLAHLLGGTPANFREYEFGNCGISYLEISDNTWKLHKHNYRGHLS